MTGCTVRQLLCTLPGSIRRQFILILVAECQSCLDQKWNFEHPLVFAHIIIKKKPGAHRMWEIWTSIILKLNLWKRSSHTGLVRDTYVEGMSREILVSKSKEYWEGLAWCFHSAMLFVKLPQAVQQLTNRNGGGCLLPEDMCINS